MVRRRLLVFGYTICWFYYAILRERAMKNHVCRNASTEHVRMYLLLHSVIHKLNSKDASCKYSHGARLSKFLEHVLYVLLPRNHASEFGVNVYIYFFSVYISADNLA